MTVIKIIVGQLQTNCFLVADQATGEAVIIDPGDDADLIIQKIQDEKLKPKALVSTHGHFDHILAANELKFAFQIPLFLHKNDNFLVRKIQSSAKYFNNFDPGPPPKIDEKLKGGDKIKFGKSELQVMEIPGHTPGSIGLWAVKQKLIFVGDVIFAGGDVGRTDYSYGDPIKLQQSIERLLKLPPDSIIYCGHGPETTVSKEKKYHAVKMR